MMPSPTVLASLARFGVRALTEAGWPIDPDAGYLVGGWVRDVLSGRVPRDWDLALRAPFPLPGGGWLNRWGGRKLATGPLAWDVWRWEDTWGFRATGLPAHPDHYAAVCVFDADSGLYCPGTATLWADALQRCLVDRRLDVSSPWTLLTIHPTPARNVAKALWLAWAYDLRWSPAVTAYAADVLESRPAACADVLATWRRRYGLVPPPVRRRLAFLTPRRSAVDHTSFRRRP